MPQKLLREAGAVQQIQPVALALVGDVSVRLPDMTQIRGSRNQVCENR